MPDAHCNKYDVIIIGGGPAGLAAAIESSRRGLSSVILDRNKKPGKKLYATGNGRCNVTNAVMDASCYYGHPFVGSLLEEIVKEEGMPLSEWVLRYLDTLGVPCAEKNGYYYPKSMQASTVVWALSDAAKMAGAEIITGAEVLSAEKKGDLYIVKTRSGEEYGSRGIILAAGGASQPRLGAFDVLTYTSLKNDLNLAFRPFRPVLGPVPVKGIPETLSGVRVQGKITAEGLSESGELQLLTDTLSGIAAFQVSPVLRPGSAIQIDLLEDVPEESFISAFQTMRDRWPERRLDAFLNGYLPDKLANHMISIILGDEKRKSALKEIPSESILRLYHRIRNWDLVVTGEVSADASQASDGGLLTDAVSSATMAIAGHPGLYAAGEVLDVLGKCGGYNISFAIRTGYLAGKNIKVESK